MRLRGSIARETKWEIVVDLYFFREPEEAEKEEQATKEIVPIKVEVEAPPHDDWMATEPQNWPEQDAVVPPPATTGAPAVYNTNEDWANEVQGEWNNVTPQPAPAQTNWGTNTEWP